MLNFRITGIFLAITFLILAWPMVQFAKAPTTSSCNVSAYIIDKDPDGLNVRTQPHGKIVGKLTENSVISITGSRGSWLRFMGVMLPPEPNSYSSAFRQKAGLTGKNWRKRVENLQGWVYANLTEVAIQNYNPTAKVSLHERPNNKSKIIYTFQEPETPAKVNSCKGEWLNITTPKKKTGWISKKQTCSLAWTTCA